jgi:hypothetical protein
VICRLGVQMQSVASTYLFQMARERLATAKRQSDSAVECKRNSINIFQKDKTMAEKHIEVFGIYQTRNQAERSVDDLLAAGFSSDDISVLLPENQGSKDFAHEKNTKAPEGTAAGVTAGGAIGGTLGLLAGIGALAIPGVSVVSFRQVCLR